MNANMNLALLPAQAAALLAGESDVVANLANTSALIYDQVSQINWVGFYFLRGDELVLGPFQGKPACVRLKRGRGVCWAAVEADDVTVVGDVHTFAGHIACDCATKSEMVVPLHKDGGVFGVLDVDSPIENRFDEETVARLRATAAAVEKALA